MVNKDRMILYCDRLIITFLCLLIFFLPFAKAAIEVFVWYAFFFWILKRALGYRAEVLWKMLPRTELNKALGIFMAVNLAATIFTVNSGLSFRAFFGKELKFIAIYFMLVETINNKKRLQGIFVAIIASAALITVDAAVQYFRGVDFLRGYPYSRLTASFISANGFAAWLIVIIPVFLGLLAVGKIISKKLKIILAALTLILIIYLVMTYARGAWLGFLIGFLLVAWYIVRSATFKMRMLYLVVSICLLVIFLFLPQPIKNKVTAIGRIKFKIEDATINQRIKSTVKMDDGSVFFRTKVWKEALRIIRDFPVTGSGLNTYSIVARNYKSVEGGGIYPHNSYLQMAAETGLVGLFAFLWVLFKFFQTGLKNLNQKKDFLVLGFLAGILAFLVHAFFDVHLYSLQLVVLFWFMLGLSVAVMKLE